MKENMVTLLRCQSVRSGMPVNLGMFLTITLSCSIPESSKILRIPEISTKYHCTMLEQVEHLYCYSLAPFCHPPEVSVLSIKDIHSKATEWMKGYHIQGSCQPVISSILPVNSNIYRNQSDVPAVILSDQSSFFPVIFVCLFVCVCVCGRVCVHECVRACAHVSVSV